MPLILSIINVERLENGVSPRIELDRHGALIGRSSHADWSLPDPQNYISSNHCEIEFRDGAYVLFDKSTNGTFVNGAAERMGAPHVIGEGDEITVGRYRIKASLHVASAPPPPPPPPPPPAAAGWGDPPPQPVSHTPGWGDAPLSPTPIASPPPPYASSGLPPIQQQPYVAGQPPYSAQPAYPAQQSYAAPQASGSGGWDDPAPSAAASGWGRESAGVGGTPEAAPDPWAGQDAAITGAGPLANAWAAPAVTPGVAAGDIWSKMAASNEVDWARGGFGAGGWKSPEPTPAPPPPLSAPDAGAWQSLLEAAGLAGVEIKASPREAAAAAGGLLRRLVAGLVVMMEARARAKAQLGASGTRLEFDGNNPLKFARGPEQALAQLLGPQERGYMPANRAVEDAFQDLQAHQMATLVAMQSALRSTLDRFSPAAIRERAQGRRKGIFGSREAALWEAYEREFEGVAKGSDEAFMDVFAKAFREAYEQAAMQQRR